MKNIEDLERGEAFKRKPNSSKVYIRDGYIRCTKRYECYDFDDINNLYYLKKGTRVFVDFEF